MADFDDMEWHWWDIVEAFTYMKTRRIFDHELRQKKEKKLAVKFYVKLDNVITVSTGDN